MIGIYKITNKINTKSYIGQSIHIQERWNEHLSKQSNSLISLALKKYGISNFSFEILEECNQEELNEKEMYWIKYYNTFKDGYNLTLGGDGTKKYDIEEIYQKYCELLNINKTAKEIGCGESTVRKVIREYGILNEEQGIDKPVECINPKTLVVEKQFLSLTDAAEYAGVSLSAISMALSGKHKTSGGYYWREIDKDNNFIPSEKIKSWKIKVQQIDKESQEILNVFNSAADAAEYLGKDRKNGGSQISAVCNGRKKTAYGYKWKKVD